MQVPSPTWEADYRHDRRHARHRCRSCNRIIETGERVLMARVGGGKTKALHIACADKVAIVDERAGHEGDAWTHRRLLEEQGKQYLRSCGWKLAEAA